VCTALALGFAHKYGEGTEREALAEKGLGYYRFDSKTGKAAWEYGPEKDCLFFRDEHGFHSAPVIRMTPAPLPTPGGKGAVEPQRGTPQDYNKKYLETRKGD
jgi:hypothetical protein